MRQLTFRQATLGDADDLRCWRNDPDARRWSRNSAVVGPAEHEAWLTASLRDPKRLVLIAEIEGHPVGMIRLDIRPDRVAELSWALAREHRGRGYGRELVKHALSLAEAGAWAQIHEENVASVRAAEAVGMCQVGRDGRWLHFEAVTPRRQIE